MMGDGMSVFALQAFYLLVFSSIVRRDLLEQMDPPLSSSKFVDAETDSEVDQEPADFAFNEIE